MILIQLISWIKRNTPFKKTWHIESLFVGICLLLIAFISNKGWVEFMGILAVYFTFQHSVISERLAQAEKERGNNNQPILVECHYKLSGYFIAKEFIWLIYFVILGAWSAIGGVVIFLLYPVWRKYYRKHKI